MALQIVNQAQMFAVEQQTPDSYSSITGDELLSGQEISRLKQLVENNLGSFLSPLGLGWSIVSTDNMTFLNWGSKIIGWLAFSTIMFFFANLIDIFLKKTLLKDKQINDSPIAAKARRVANTVEVFDDGEDTINSEYKKDLRIELAKLFPTVEESKLVLSDAGVSMQMIAFNTNAQVNWHNILINAENNGKLYELVDAALSMFKKNPVLRAYRANRNS